ncbi:hypothetical protein CR513_49740, partial [Mucuna pruriens]
MDSTEETWSPDDASCVTIDTTPISAFSNALSVSPTGPAISARTGRRRPCNLNRWLASHISGCGHKTGRRSFGLSTEIGQCTKIKGQQEKKEEVAEMRMLKWICGHTRSDGMQNDCIRDDIGVVPIEKMTENRLR